MSWKSNHYRLTGGDISVNVKCNQWVLTGIIKYKNSEISDQNSLVTTFQFQFQLLELPQKVFVVTLVIIKTVTAGARPGDLFNYPLPGPYHHHQGIQRF